MEKTYFNYIKLQPIIRFRPCSGLNEGKSEPAGNKTTASLDGMAEDSMALIELLQKADGGDFLRSLAEAVLQLLMEADVDGLIGASRHE